MSEGVILPLPFLTPEKLQLVSVAAWNCDVSPWYDLRLGKRTLVHVRCWTDEGWPQEWELSWAGPDNYAVYSAPKFADPVSAAHWFYDNYIKEST